MSEIHIHREHRLGLHKARQVARQWADDATARFALECALTEGDAGDTLRFVGSGVKGELRVEAGQFTLDAKLGFLLGAFNKKIQAEIEKNLEAFLEQNGSPASEA